MLKYKTTSHGSFGKVLPRSSARVNRDGSSAPIYKGYSHENTSTANIKKSFLPLQRGQRRFLHRVDSIAQLNFPKEVLEEVDALKILSRVRCSDSCLQKCLSLSQSPRGFSLNNRCCRTRTRKHRLSAILPIDGSGHIWVVLQLPCC